MSRTPRRLSRPLLIALGLIIVAGTLLTVRKLFHSPQTTAKTSASNPAAMPIHADVLPAKPAVASTAKPSVIVEARPAALPAAPAEPAALITRTPTSPVAAADAPSAPSPVAAAPVAASTVAPTLAAISDTAGNDTTALAQWATARKASAAVPAASSNVASLTGAAPTTPSASVRPAVAAPAPAVVSADPAGDAKARMASGDFVTARQILNDALIANKGDADGLKVQIAEINQTLVFSARRIPEDPWGGTYQVASGERLGSIANRCSVPWELIARVNNITPKKLRAGQWIKLVKGPFHAVVTKHSFRMDLYLGAPSGPGSMYIRSFPVGLGKDNSTPTGLWTCKSGDKIRNPRYYPPRGGEIIAPDDPKNPLGGYWIALEGAEGQALGKESYGIHGTIDPTSIGKMESMGCIRLRAEDIAWVFDMLSDGKSKVVVKD